MDRGEEYYKTNYLPFVANFASKNEKAIPLRILKSTKNVVLNTKSFNKFFKSYNDMTQIPTFKRPEISSYPLIKNEEIISLTKRSFNREIESDIKHTSSGVFDNDNLEKFIKEINNRNKRKQRNIGLRTGILNGEFLSTETNNENSSSFNTLSFIPQKKFSSALTLPRTKLSENNLEEKFHLDKLMDLEKTLKEFDMKNEVFMKFYKDKGINQEIKNFLNVKVKDLTQGATENLTMSKNKKISTSSYNINITLKSITLIFKRKYPLNDKQEFNREVSTINLPFSILPLFYYTNSSTFKSILSQIIRINENIEIDFNSLQAILQKFKAQIYNNGVLREDSNILIRNAVNHSQIDIVCLSNVFELIIDHPKIEFTIERVNKQTNENSLITYYKYVDKELIIFIVMSNFIKWDFYILNYLSRYKLFRDTLTHFVNTRKSKIKINNDHTHEEKKINLDENINSSNSNTSNVLEYDLIICLPLPDSIIYLYQKIVPYSIEVNVEKFPEKDFVFNLNFQHMNRFERIKDFWNVEEFITKCLTVNYVNETVVFCYKSIETIDEEYLNFLKVTNYKNKQKVIESDREKSLAVVINEPAINWTGLRYSKDGLSLKKQSFKIPESIMNRLLKSDISHWSFIFQSSISELQKIFMEEELSSSYSFKKNESGFARRGSSVKKSITKFHISNKNLKKMSLLRNQSFLRRQSANPMLILDQENLMTFKK